MDSGEPDARGARRRGSDRRRGFPLAARVGGAALLAYTVATLVAGLFLATALDQRAEADRERLVESHAAMLERVARRDLSAGRFDRLDSDVRAAADLPDLRVTVVLPDGEVVAESERPLPLANHADRPEIVEALRTGRGRAVRDSDTIGEPHLYLARRIDDANGAPLGVLRLSMPQASARSQTSGIAVLLLLASLVGVPVATLVGWLAARRIVRPLEEMTVAATRGDADEIASLPFLDRADETGRLARALRQMRNELSRSLDASEADRAELTAMLESMLEGVVALDAERRVVRANRDLAEILGLAAPPAPGTPVTDLTRDADFLDVVDTALSREQVEGRDVRAPGSPQRLLNVSAAPILAAGGTVSGAVLVLRDVTELRRLERARLDFVANVSHELRTPVAAMLAALETEESLGAEEAEARKRLLTNAYRNARRLSSIVNDLLALSAIETEETQMERWPVPLGRSLRTAAASLSAEAERAGVRVDLPPSGNEEVLVLAHESRLELVWVNLIGNAIKFTQSGGSVRVRIDVLHDERQAEVSVADTGSGIPPAQLSRIFERFFRVDKARSRDSGGTGLGLAIVRHIVVAHEGSIAVESEVGVGSRFIVRLPLASRDDERPNSAA